MSFRCNMHLTGIDALSKRIISELNTLARDAVIATGKVVKVRAKQGPFKDHTRQLRSTIQDHNIGKRGPWYLVEVRAPMKYASFVEKGTADHPIWPKAVHGLTGPVRQGQTRRATGKGPHEYIVGRGLALRWHSGGQIVFCRYVAHHKSKPYPFMEPAADYGRRYITDFTRRGFVGISTRLESH
jgi:hypothetical protein